MEAPRPAALTADLTEPIEWFLDFVRVERAGSRHTVEAYFHDLTRAAEFFSGRGMATWPELTAEQRLAYEASLAQEARATAVRRLAALRSFLKFLKKNHAGPAVDLPSTGGWKRPQRIPKALSRAQLEALLTVPNLAEPSGLRDRALMELIYGLGLRVSEAVSLELSAWHQNDGLIRVEGKRAKVRHIPIPTGTDRWLRRYLAEARPRLVHRPLANLLVSDRGRPLRRERAYTILATAAQRAGLPDGISPHTLRHTYAVHLLHGGANLREVQELLGHESVETTQVYTQLDLAAVRAAYDRAHPRR